MNQKKTERAWSIKDVSHGQKVKFSCGTNVGSQSERRFRFILPARGFSRIKRTVIGQVLFLALLKPRKIVKNQYRYQSHPGQQRIH